VCCCPPWRLCRTAWAWSRVVRVCLLDLVLRCGLPLSATSGCSPGSQHCACRATCHACMHCVLCLRLALLHTTPGSTCRSRHQTCPSTIAVLCQSFVGQRGLVAYMLDRMHCVLPCFTLPQAAHAAAVAGPAPKLDVLRRAPGRSPATCCRLQLARA
jgi:hypothetical protein